MLQHYQASGDRIVLVVEIKWALEAKCVAILGHDSIDLSHTLGGEIVSAPTALAAHSAREDQATDVVLSYDYVILLQDSGTI
jgi:hypothetical protein